MSTMLGPVDAQMTDYNDLDVLMQAHSSDPWAHHDDGAMEDDHLSSFPMTSSKSAAMEFGSSNSISATATDQIAFTPSQAPTEIEVEMEEYSEEHAEYEMLDDSEVIDEDSHELLDVEVMDTHSSPAVIPASIPISLSTSFTPTLVLESSLSTAPVPTPTEATSDTPAEPVHQSPHEDVPPFVEETPIIEAETVEAASSSAPEPTHPNPETADDTDPTTSGAQEDRSDMPSFDDEQPPPAEAVVNDNEAIEIQEHLVPLAASDSQGSNTQATENVYSTSENVPTEEREPIQPEAHIEEEHASPASNPHEIAEGVYIEPPPAVVFRTSGSEPPFVLFNRPSSSRSHTPALDADVPSDPIVLLQDHPTLYYEPLPSLFQALRSTEPLLKLPDLHRSELGLCIESLDLTFFEDNAYYRDYTLHDLSIMHDSFHSGLLRIQLQQRTPRFLVRWEELEQQLHQLAQDEGFPPNVPGSTNQELFEEKPSTTDQPEANHEDHVLPGEEEHEPSGNVAEVANDQGATFDFASNYEQPSESDDQEAVTSDEFTIPEMQEPAVDHSTLHPEQDPTQFLEDDEEPAADDHHAGHDSHEPEASVGHDETVEEEGALPPNDDVDDHPLEAHEELPEEDDAEASAQHAEVDVDTHSAEVSEVPVEGDEAVPHDPEDQHDPGNDISAPGEEPADPVQDAEVAEEPYPGEDDESSDLSYFDPEEGQDQLSVYQEEEQELGEYDESEEYERVGEEQYEGDDALDGNYEGEVDDEHVEVVERPASPDAVAELPPIDTEGHTEGGENDQEPSATATTVWSSEQFELTEVEQEQEQESSNIENGDVAENVEDVDNDLTHPDAVPGDDDQWDDDLDGEGEPDPAWDQEEEEDNNSNQSSVTLSSSVGKRTFNDTFDADDDELEANHTPSPDSKRSRLH